jgi:integrase
MSSIDRTTPAGARDRAIVAVLVVGGLRLDELAGLTMASYDAANGRLVVNGKGNKQRAVYIGVARLAVGEWLAYRGNEAGALFCPVNRGGRVVMVERMTAQAVYNMLDRRRLGAGLASFSPHDFRRTAIGNMLSAGVDIATIARHVGHASVTTTARYDRRPEAQQRAAVERIAVPGI